MANSQIPDADTVRQLLDYDPETGTLRWKVRSVHWFEPCERLTAEKKCNAWNGRNAGRMAFTASDGKGYLQWQVAKYHTMAHRVAWVIMHGNWPALIDHIDGDGTNNRLHNLRVVTAAENAMNSAMPRNNTSGCIGVRFVKRFKRWEAFITFRGKSIYLGMFSTMDEAIAARKTAERGFGFHENHGRPLRYHRNLRARDGVEQCVSAPQGI